MHHLEHAIMIAAARTEAIAKKPEAERELELARLARDLETLATISAGFVPESAAAEQHSGEINDQWSRQYSALLRRSP